MHIFIGLLGIILYKAVAQMIEVGIRYGDPETNHPPSVADRKEMASR